MRLGRGARQFEIVKLRTMSVDAERLRGDGVVEDGDPRITRVGACCGARPWTSCRSSGTCCAAR